ncbi:MAG: antirestriction protein ArdA [Nitrososphaerota archaeon]|jgi:antirestriction protein|nr:antirestriction protein ArdA [Nitrososphaerota archaeon]
MCKQNFSKSIDQTIKQPQLKVYVANLGKYNEGKLYGAWLNLPTAHNQIQTFLKTQVGLNKQYEEIAIHDYESNFNLGEHENLYDLNLLAVVLEQMSETEKNLASAYCNFNGLKTSLEILNVCVQIDDLFYVELDANSWGSREEKLGYALLDGVDSDLRVALEQCQIGNGLSVFEYFDFEKYGRDVSISDGYFVGDGFFVFYASDVNSERYTLQELRDLIDDPCLQ